MRVGMTVLELAKLGRSIPAERSSRNAVVPVVRLAQARVPVLLGLRVGRFGAEDERDAAVGVEFHGFVEVDAVEGDGVLAAVGGDVVQLGVLDPIIGQAVHGAIA